MSSVGAVPIALVIDLLLDAVCVVDADGRYLLVSAAFERIFGYRPDEVVGRPMIDLVLPEDRPKTLDAVAKTVAGDIELHFENRYVRKDGRIVDIMWSARWAPEHGMRVAVARDITARKRAEAMQAALYALSDTANRADALPAWFAEVHRIVADLLPLTNLTIALASEGDDDDAPLRFAFDSAGGTGSRTARRTLAREVVDRCKAMRGDGDGMLATLPESPDAGDAAPRWTGVQLFGPGGCIGALLVELRRTDVHEMAAAAELLQFVATQIAAVIERKRNERRLRHAAGHDPLTDLPNRTLVHDRITVALSRVRREQTQLSLLFLDVDGFKEINDRLGHAAGDAILREIARRLRRSVRESDTVGRIGGDEFIVLFDGVQSGDQALHLAEALRLAIDTPFEIGGDSLSTSISIGIASYPEHGADLPSLLAAADAAMYRAKKAGGNRYHVALSGPAVPAISG